MLKVKQEIATAITILPPMAPGKKDFVKSP
jgi:hypothetical protein